jgi:hypothetical protein
MKTKTEKSAMDGYETHQLHWRGKEIEIGYQPRSFAGSAHLQIRTKHCQPLPITETGYRSHFTSAADVEHLGGPAAYVEAWLNTMAETKAWKRAERDGVQLTLF